MAIVHLTKVERGQLKDIGAKLREIVGNLEEILPTAAECDLLALAHDVEWLADAFAERERLANRQNR